VVVVSRRDLRVFRREGGSLVDRQQTGVRRGLASTVDVLLHAFVGVLALGYVLGDNPGLSFLLGVGALVGAWVVFSVVHRVLVQWVTRATLGRFLFALRTVRSDTGRRPTLGMLVKAWVPGLGGPPVSDRPAHVPRRPVVTTKPTPAERSEPLVTTVRLTDIRKLRRSDPIPNPPKFHGHANDPRYPSPTGWRIVSAFAIDLVVHLGLTAGVFFLLAKRDLSAGALVAFSIGAFCAVSFVHRVLVQWAVQATVGKLFTGLRVIDENTGGRENPGSLAWAWLAGVFYFVVGTLSLFS
jgi:hypothetical protein